MSFQNQTGEKGIYLVVFFFVEQIFFSFFFLWKRAGLGETGELLKFLPIHEVITVVSEHGNQDHCCWKKKSENRLDEIQSRISLIAIRVELDGISNRTFEPFGCGSTE